MGLTTVAIIYSVVLTIAFLLLEMRQRRVQPPYLIELERFNLDQLTPQEQHNALLQCAKLANETIPWWQRAISTLGVIALFSTTIATAVQTITVSVETGKVETLRQQVEDQRRQLSRGDRMLGQIADTVLLQAQRTGSLSSNAKEVLNERLRQISAIPEPEKTQVDDAFRIALALGDGSTVIELVDRHPEVLDGANTADRVATAEYFYFTAADEAAIEQLKGLQELDSKTPVNYRVRVLALSAALKHGNLDELTQKYAALMKLETSRARSRLEGEAERLKQSRARYMTERTATS